MAAWIEFEAEREGFQPLRTEVISLEDFYGRELSTAGCAYALTVLLKDFIRSS